MARPEPSNMNSCVAASSIPTRPTNFNKDQFQRNDEIKSEFQSREGIYKISALIDNLGKLGTNTCLSEPVKITLLHRSQLISNPNSSTSSRRSSSTGNPIEETRTSLTSNGNVLITDILAFNVGRELIVYEFTEATQSNFSEPIDHRVYKQNHQPTCHDITQNPNTNILHVLVGFSKGQIQYINMHTKEQKVFNEGSYLDKSKVTCIKWLTNPRTSFMASYSSGYLYVFDEQLNYQRDTNIQPSYSVIRDDEKNFSISYTKNKTKQARNPISRWAIGNGSINEFAFSPDQTLLAVVSQDGFLRIFHYEKMSLIAYMKSYFGGLLCVCWSPDGKYLATGGEDDFITLFSLDPDDQQARVLCRGHGHTSWISAISFDPYMNAKSYYSSLIPRSSSSLSNDVDDGVLPSKNIVRTRNDSNIPTHFYRLASVGQDNRLCLWDITEDILKMNSNSKIPSHSSTSAVSSASNGYGSLMSDSTINSTTNSSQNKSSFSSLTSRLSFVRHSNKIHKTNEETSSDLSIGNGLAKKSKKNLVHITTNSDESNSSSLTTLVQQQNQSSSRRTNFDLTRTTFGTPLCPKLDEIQLIEPVVTELIAHERLNGIFFGENYLLTSSQDGIIAIWEKPQKYSSTNNAIDDRNSNSHHSTTVSQRL